MTTVDQPLPPPTLTHRVPSPPSNSHIDPLASKALLALVSSWGTSRGLHMYSLSPSQHTKPFFNRETVMQDLIACQIYLIFAFSRSRTSSSLQSPSSPLSKSNQPENLPHPQPPSPTAPAHQSRQPSISSPANSTSLSASLAPASPPLRTSCDRINYSTGQAQRHVHRPHVSQPLMGAGCGVRGGTRRLV